MMHVLQCIITPARLWAVTEELSPNHSGLLTLLDSLTLVSPKLNHSVHGETHGGEGRKEKGRWMRKDWIGDGYS